MFAPRPKKHKIYFAYGGNIHLKQMAKRCPGARYLGVAKLEGYRWQINERGYANIIKILTSAETGLEADKDAVQGLAFLVNAEDEARLDRAEGVPTAYQKKSIDVGVVVAGARLVGRDVSEVMSLSSEELKAGSGEGLGSEGSRELVQALVYVSKDFTKDGLPRVEYAARMRLGLQDALNLGMAREYAEDIEKMLATGVRPDVGGSPKPPASPKASQQRGRRQAITNGTRPPTAASKTPTYYFAFGSNMHLSQMAARCPDSKLFGKGSLAGYRWQINERGVANIVPVAEGANGKGEIIVQGLIFTVSTKDIKTLDANEGIAHGFYDKASLRVRVESLALLGIKGVKTTIAAKDLSQLNLAKGENQLSKLKVEEVEALVYLSSQYMKDGTIRTEYIGRMQSAMADALKLGVDEAYLKSALYPWVFRTRTEAPLSPGRQEYVIIEPSSGPDRAAASPKGRKIIERVPGGTGFQLGAEDLN